MRYTARLFIAAFAFVLIIGVAAPALSVSWTPKISEFSAVPIAIGPATITASFSGGSDPATFGTKFGATGGFDPAYGDSPQPPAPPAKPYVQAYFYYQSNPVGYTLLDKSYIAPGDNLVWDNLRILYNDYQGPDPKTVIMTLSWNLENIPTSFSVLLYRYTGGIWVDMRAVGNYNFTITVPAEDPENPGTEYTATVRFKIVVILTADTTPPPEPALILPENCHDIFDNTPTFEWTTVTDPSGVVYEIWIDDSIDFSSPVYMVFENENTHTLPDENALEICVHYWWRVRAWDLVGNMGEWSEEWHFHVVPIGAIGVLLMSLFMLLPFALMLRRQNRRYP